MNMRCLLLFFVAVLKIGLLKTESIDYEQKNDQVQMMYPPRQSKLKDLPQLHPIEKSMMSNDQQHEWNEAASKFQPNDALQRIFNFDDIEEYDTEDVELPEDQFKPLSLLDDVEAAHLTSYLMKLLQRPGTWDAPIILIRDPQDNSEDRAFPLAIDGLRNVSKRSRYYRRYPWKRQNSRNYQNMEYDPYNQCTPTKDDVFKLLMALHETRQGKKSKSINFCNRVRPASAVYTNIRFLGRRRK